MLLKLLSLFILITSTFSAPAKSHLPIVLFHGMGDSCCSENSMGIVTEVIKKTLGKDTFVYSIRIGENDDADKKASFFGNLNQQINEVCDQLANVTELSHGFNAIGFSQGGQFLRAYVERCNKPPIHNLITYGSQHMGIADLPGCQDSEDWQCRAARAMALKGVYIPWIQNRVVQAQYFRDPNNLDTYLKRNIFLPDINNEYPLKSDDEEMPTGKNSTYKINFSSVNKFVMIKFTEDNTVVPPETAWFGYYDEEGEVVSMKDLDIYKKDWIGLKSLDERHAIHFEECPGAHMQLSEDHLIEMLEKYCSDSALQAKLNIVKNQLKARIKTPVFINQSL